MDQALIKKIIFEGNQVQDVLHSMENRRLLLALDQFAKLLTKYGYQVEVYSPKSLIHLNTISAEKKDSIAVYYENWSRWITPDASEVFNIPISEEKEKAFLKYALDHYGLEVSDDFIDTIKTDQVIKVYGADIVQIYRSLNFFKHCGYPLLDISIYEWYALWARPAKIIEKMQEEAMKTLENATTVRKMNVPKHVTREIMDSENAPLFIPSASVVDFKYIGCLKKNNIHKPSAFICSATAEITGRGVEAANIQFV